MTRRILVLAAAVAALGAPAAPRADAAHPDRPLGLLLRLGFEFGGETLFKATYSDGSTETLKAGQGVNLAGGLLYRAPVPLALEATFGWKQGQISGSNGTIKLTRYPIDLIASYSPVTRVGGGALQHRLGGGATLHHSPKLSCDVSGICSGAVEFKDAWGAIAQYVLSLPINNSGLELGVRYTWIDYKLKGAGAEKVDGNCFGFFFGGWI